MGRVYGTMLWTDRATLRKGERDEKVAMSERESIRNRMLRRGYCTACLEANKSAE